MRKLTLPVAVALMLLATACQTFYTGVVSLTQIVDGAAKSYASLYNQGLVPPDVAAKVAAVHLQYRIDAKVAQDALIAYKASGDGSTYQQAFALAQQAAASFVAAVIPLFAPQDAIALQTQLKKVNAL